MSTHTLLMWAVVVAVGVSAALRNPTVAALVIAKLAGWIYARVTGADFEQMLKFYPFTDIFIIAMVMAKNERSVADRVILLIFPIMWCVYVSNLHDYYRWWSLYYLVLAQFFAAGWESLTLLRHPKVAADIKDNPSSDAEYRVAWGWTGSG